VDRSFGNDIIISPSECTSPRVRDLYEYWGKLRGDRFRVTDKRGSQEVHSGEPVVVESRNGVRHELVLRAFEGRAASEVTVRR